MKLNRISILCAVLVLSSMAVNAQTTKKAKAPVKKTVQKSSVTSQVLLKNEKDSLSYALGLDIAKSIMSNGFEVNAVVLNTALNQSFKGEAVLMDEQKKNEVIQKGFKKLMDKKNEALIKPQTDFLAKNKQNPNIKQTPEGVQYEILVQGSGAQAKVGDEVVVHYLGTLINGEKFDSSYDRNEPLSLDLDRVIEGWKIGIPLMQVGSKYKFYIPYNLGYGERGTGNIPAYSTLIFEVELLEVKGKNAI